MRASVPTGMSQSDTTRIDRLWAASRLVPARNDHFALVAELGGWSSKLSVPAVPGHPHGELGFLIERCEALASSTS